MSVARPFLSALLLVSVLSAPSGAEPPKLPQSGKILRDAGAASAGSGTGTNIRVDPLKPGDVDSDGAFWVWFLPKSGPGKVKKVAEMDMTDQRMVLRINGKVERLMKRSATWRPPRDTRPRPGDVCEEIWGNSSYVLELTYTMAKSEYEYSAFAGKMTVSPSSTAWRAGMHAAPAALEVEGETGS